MRTPSDMKGRKIFPVDSAQYYNLSGWNGVLNTSMILVSCLYIAVGFFGKYLGLLEEQRF